MTKLELLQPLAKGWCGDRNENYLIEQLGD